MSNMIRQTVILILLATFIVALDFSKGVISPIVQAGASDYSSGYLQQTERSDTTGPEINPVSLSITSPEQPLQLTMADPSGVLNSSFAVQGIEGKAFEIAYSADLVEIRVSGGWPRGAHHIRVEASDQLGNQTIKSFWLAVAPTPPQSLQRVSQQGTINVDASQFPLGLYQVTEENFAKVKAAGFNLVHDYWWEITPNNRGLREYLDMAYAAGLKVFLGFDRGIHSNQGLMQMNLAHLAERVAEVRDHPALLAWYLYDEPDHEWQYVAPRDLKILYDTLKLLDPYHPIVVTFAWPKSLERYGTDCFDIYWIIAYLDAEENDQKITRDTKVLGPNKPFLTISSAYDEEKSDRLQAGLPFNDQGFKPDKTKMRADAYLALTRGSSGLCWWWYGDNRQEYVSVGDTPEAWAWLAQVVGEINELVPVLSGTGQDLSIEVECDPPSNIARARAIRSGSQITIMTVNTSSNQETQVTIKSSQFPYQATALGKFETPNSEITNRELRVTLPPLGVHVYEVNS